MKPPLAGFRRVALRALILAAAATLFSPQAFPQTISRITEDSRLRFNYYRPHVKLIVDGCRLRIPEGFSFEAYGLEAHGGSIIIERHTEVVLHGPPDQTGALDGALVLRPDASGLITSRLEADMATIKAQVISLGSGSFAKIENSWLEGASIIGSADSKLELKDSELAFTADGILQRIETAGTVDLLDNNINPNGVIIGGINVAGSDTAFVTGNTLRNGSIRAGNADGAIQIIKYNFLRNGGALLFNNVRFEANRLDSAYIAVWPGYGLAHYREPRGSNVSIIDNELTDPPSLQHAPYYAIAVTSMDNLDVSENIVLGQVAESPDVRTKGISWSESTGRIYRNLFTNLKISDTGVSSHDGQIMKVANTQDLGSVEIRDNVIQYSGLSDLATNPKTFSLVDLDASVHFIGNEIRDNQLYGFETIYRNEPAVSLDDGDAFGDAVVFSDNHFMGNEFMAPSEDTKYGTKGILLSVDLSVNAAEISGNVFWGNDETLAMAVEAEFPDGKEHESVKVHDNYFFQNKIGAWVKGAPDFSGNNSFSHSWAYHMVRSGVQPTPLLARNNYWAVDEATAIDALLFDDDEHYSLALIDFSNYDSDELVLSAPTVERSLLEVGESTGLTLNVATTSGNPATEKTVHVIVSDPSVARVEPRTTRTDVAGNVTAVLEALGAGYFDVMVRSTGYESTSGLINVKAVGLEPAVASELPRDGVSLEPSYPNPVRARTTVVYSIASPSEVSLTIHDILGRRIQLLDSGAKPAGTFTANFDATGLAAGVYFCRLVAGGHSRVRSLVVVR